MRKLKRSRQRQLRRNRKFRQRAIAAGATAIISLAIGANHRNALAAYTPDPHELPVSQDADSDLLSDSEETALAYLTFIADQNQNGVPDGVELAKLCVADINDLPWQADAAPGQTYKWWAPQFGVETCDICGESIVMGPGGVVNPTKNISVGFPFLMTLHYMEHGSFSYAAHNGQSPSKGRVDVPALLQALELRLTYNPEDHQLPVDQDPDEDLLSNQEEIAIGYHPFKSDQNLNEIPDGIELAKRCVAVVAALPQEHEADPNEPYKVEHALDGIERCQVCGQWIHMGGWEIFNPKLNLRYPDPNDPLEGTFLPDLALHYMEHGSFDCYGDDHQGRVHIPHLMRVIEFRFPYDPNDHQLPLDYVVEPAGQLAPDANDLDDDLLADTEELAAGYNLYDADQNQNLNPDGIELAKRFHEIIKQLPVHDPSGGDPPPKQTYRIEHEARGEERCEICGAIRNMGTVEIVNPQPPLRIELPYISLHYMEHGSFSHFGSYVLDSGGHAGRINIPILHKILEMPRQCGDLGTIYLPGDFNQDCIEDLTDFAEFVAQWLESTDPNEP